MSWWFFLSPSSDHSSDGCRIVIYPVSTVIEPCDSCSSAGIACKMFEGHDRGHFLKNLSTFCQHFCVSA